MGMMDRVVEWERRNCSPVPLDLSDAEVLDWMDEYCDQAVYNRPTAEYRGGFIIYSGGTRTKQPTLREAVCLAAAKLKEENE